MSNKVIQKYNLSQADDDSMICHELMQIIGENLKYTQSKIWHAHPVWFIDGNPIVGYGKLKGCIRLMFWSGMGFDEEDLVQGTGKFQDASIRYTSPEQIDTKKLKRWLKKSESIQWDYKNVVRRKGVLKKIG